MVSGAVVDSNNLHAEARSVPSVSASVVELLSSQLPCALLDGKGYIVRVSPGLSEIAPSVLSGQQFDHAFGISQPVIDDKPSIGVTTKYGVHRSVSGELIPIVAQFCPLPNDNLTSLVVVFDGRSFRDADASRLAAAPYPIIRLDLDEKVVFANTPAANVFGIEADALHGQTFSQLFNIDDQRNVAAAFDLSLRNERVSPMNVTLFSEQASKGHPVLLSLISDQAPGGRVLGAVAVLHSQKLERARNAIKRIAVERADWRIRLQSVLQEIRSFVAFDGATFGIYAEHVTLFRWLYVEPQDEKSWPGHWVPFGDSVKSWLSTGDTWADDLREFVGAYPELMQDPIVRQHLDWGHRAFVTLPVAGQDGPTSSLSLVSKVPALYGRDALELLKELDLERVLMIFERDAAEERRAFCQTVKNAIGAAGSLPRAAAILVQSLREFFHWNHISIITVDERKGEFRILSQASDPDCALPQEFVQLISEGMLGATLDAARNQRDPEVIGFRIEDTRTLPRKYNFVPTNERLLSAMTYPIRLSGEWRWIINVEAAVTNAFHGPDTEALRELALALEGELDRLYRSELNRVLLEKMPDGVIIVGPTGWILSANRTAAERFLGRKASFGRLEDYAADDTTLEILGGRLADTSRRLMLRAEDGQISTVLATRNDLSEEYQSSVWFLSDVDNFHWNVDYRYLRAVVNDVAQQTRGSLMLASTTMQKLASEFRDHPLHGSIELSVDRTLAEIAKADITFERLASAHSIIRDPVRERERINLGRTLKELISALPDRDQKRIRLSIRGQSTYIVGDVSRLRSAFRFMLGYLLRYRSDDDITTTMVEVSLKRIQKNCVVSLAISGTVLSQVAADEPLDPLWQSESKGHDDAGLGLEVIDTVIKAHDGTLITANKAAAGWATSGPAWASFQVKLPIAKKGTLANE
jgi:PAS domain-containing protein